jgi:hypothetical protein
MRDGEEDGWLKRRRQIQGRQIEVRGGTVVVIDPVFSGGNVAANVVSVKGAVAHLCAGRKEGGEKDGKAMAVRGGVALSSWCVLCMVGCACFNWELWSCNTD